MIIIKDLDDIRKCLRNRPEDICSSDVTHNSIARWRSAWTSCDRKNKIDVINKATCI